VRNISVSCRLNGLFLIQAKVIYFLSKVGNEGVGGDMAKPQGESGPVTFRADKPRPTSLVARHFPTIIIN
jgi:hypothetical protein